MTSSLPPAYQRHQQQGKVEVSSVFVQWAFEKMFKHIFATVADESENAHNVVGM
jgi:hypothetical protein